MTQATDEAPADDPAGLPPGVAIPARRRFWLRLGAELLEAEGGRSRTRLRLEESHMNMRDIAHGGTLAALVDCAAGAATSSVRRPDLFQRGHSTSDLHISYYRPASGSELIAIGQVVRAGRTAVFVDVDVYDDQERQVAHATVTMIVAKPGTNHLPFADDAESGG
jgi:acyl-CoA thioesterase